MNMNSNVLRSLLLIALGLTLAGCAILPSRPALPVRILGGPGIDPNLTVKEGRPLYALAREFDYCFDKTGDVIAIPEGFVTDFASIPCPLCLLLSPDGPYAQAAIIHDYLYALGTPGDEVGRKYADDVLMAAMIDYNVPQWKRDAVYSGVRVGGRGGYGLPTDWQLVSISTLSKIAAPKPPSRVAANLKPGCRGFQAWSDKRGGYREQWGGAKSLQPVRGGIRPVAVPEKRAV
jgi:hypothetical protein